MRRTVVTSEIQVIGRIWLPPVMAAYNYNLSDYDLGNIGVTVEGTVTRDDIAEWLSKNAGDFQEVIDFRADISYGPNDWVIEWENPDSELIYNDCMFPQDDND